MSILHGFHQANSGAILIDGHEVTIQDSRAAYRHGIGMVYQHFMLIDRFTVLENIMLGAESGPLLARSAAQARAALTQLADTYGLHVDPAATVATLPLGQRQRVEILRALYRGARILILDEPTGVLTPAEADDLFRVLRALRDQGAAILLVTHKLREIMAVTDRVSVMRAGAMVAHRTTAETTQAELGELMIGRRPTPVPRPEARPESRPGPLILEARNLTITDDAGIPRVHDLDLHINAGEILAIAGVAGNGQGELLEALAGLRRPTQGTIRLQNAPLYPAPNFDPATLRARGIAHIPEDRLRDALLPSATAADTAILGHQADPAYRTRLFLLSPARIAAHALGLMRAYDVRPPNPALRAAQLSGGNQQKLVLAREIERDPLLLLVGQPTRGVDIGGIEAIHTRLLAARAAGKAILLVSVELDEILALADRILVLSAGRLIGELPIAEATIDRLAPLIAGLPDPATAHPNKLPPKYR